MNTEEPAITDWLSRASAIASPATTSSTNVRPCAQLGDRGYHTDQQQEGGSRLVVTLTGWRRRCLFGFLLILTIIVIINLSLTLWLLRAMQFSLNGMGNLKITPSGIQLNGEAMAMDTLMTSHIHAREGRPLVLDSSQNITITARDNQGRSYNQLFLGDDRLEVQAREFSVKNSRNELLFSANRREVHVGADVLRVSGVGGAVFEGSIQTQVVRAEPGEVLTLESPTRSLHVQAAQRVKLESLAGELAATCYQDLRLKSTGGSIKLDSSSVMLPNIRTAAITAKAKNSSQTKSSVQIYQVCVCSNGRLFISPPDGSCMADDTICG